jgi:hypothetical protein
VTPAFEREEIGGVGAARLGAVQRCRGPAEPRRRVLDLDGLGGQVASKVGPSTRS